MLNIYNSVYFNFHFSWSIFKEKGNLERTDLIFRISQLLLAEYIGTGMLLFWGCASSGLLNESGRGVGPWLFGIAVFTSIHIFAPISNSHINPAVTLTFFIYGHTSLVLSLLYVAAQILGALTGYGILWLASTHELTSYGFHKDDFICVTMLKEDFSPAKGVFLEALGTGLVCLLVCRVCNPINQKHIGNISIEFSCLIALASYVLGPYTGGSLNPARSFGPALIRWQFKDHWIYWIGPILGSVVTSFIYHVCFVPKVYYVKKDEVKQ